MEFTTVLKPEADSLVQWTLVPSDGSSAASHVDDSVDASDGDATYARTNDDGVRLRLRLEELPANLGQSTQITIRAAVRADSPIDTEARIVAQLVVNGAEKSSVVPVEDLGSAPYVVKEWTASDWQVSASDVVEVQFTSALIQSDPPSIQLRAYITAVEVVITYTPLPRLYFVMDDTAGTIYNELTANSPVYTPLSEPTTIYTPVVIS